MTIVELQMLVSIVAMLITIGTALWSWLSAPSRKNEKTLQEHGVRLDVIETRMGHLARHEDIHSIELSLNGLKGEIAVLVERVKPLIATTERINELLLEQARKNL